MKQFTQSGIEFEVLTGAEERDNNKLGRVLVKSNTAIGAHGYTEKWTQLFKNKQGFYITLNKEKTFIEVPKGEWVKGVENKVFPSGKVFEIKYTKWIGENGTEWKAEH